MAGPSFHERSTRLLGARKNTNVNDHRIFKKRVVEKLSNDFGKMIKNIDSQNRLIHNNKIYDRITNHVEKVRFKNVQFQ